MKRTLLSWSSGKDSAWTLHVLRQMPDISVGALLTTISEEDDRVTMHGVRRTLVEAQAAAVGLPLWTVAIPSQCPDEIYRSRMQELCGRARREGYRAMAFGDLFLEDVRRYREQRLHGTGLEALFPLWKEPTAALARRMIASGLKAKIACVDTRHIEAKWAGRDFDFNFLLALAPGIDPCAERGEFHTFVYDSPDFAAPLKVVAGDVVTRDGYAFADIS